MPFSRPFAFITGIFLSGALFLSTAAAVDCAGLLPPTPAPLSPEEILDGAEALSLRKIEISIQAMQADNDIPVATRILAEILGRPLKPSRLFADWTRYHKKPWAEVIKEVHLRLKRGRISLKTAEDKKNSSPDGPPVRLSENQIIEILQKLHAAGFQINKRAMAENQNPDQAREIIAKVTGTPFKTSAVYNRAVKTLKKSWKDWIHAAGLSLDGTSARLPRLQKDFILKALSLLHEQDVDLRPTALKEPTPRAQKLLLQLTGRNIPLSKLYYDALHPYKNPWPRQWNWWLREAGLDPEEISRPPRRLSKEVLLLALQRLYTAGLPMGLPGFLAQKENPSAQQILLETTGENLTTEGFYKILRAYGLPWRQWLKETGFPLESLLPPKPLWTGEEIVEGLRILHEAGAALNYAEVSGPLQDPNYRKILTEHFGRFASPYSLYYDAVWRHKISWDAWLVRAGLNPNEIRRRGQAPLAVLTAAMRADLAGHYNGLFERRRVYLTGPSGPESVVVDDRTPEADLMQQEVSAAYEKLENSLSSEEKQWLDFLLDYFSLEKDLNFQEIADYMEERSGEKIQPDEILAFFRKIRERGDLRELFGPLRE
jgi:hypothetical protein